MPIVTVELVVDESHGRASKLAQLLADGVARALQSAPAETWVRVRWLPRRDYAENESSLADDQLPVFVTVLKRSSPDASELETEIASVTEVIARIVHRRGDQIHIEYLPAAAGRMAFGGKLVQ